MCMQTMPLTTTATSTTSTCLNAIYSHDLVALMEMAASTARSVIRIDAPANAPPPSATPAPTSTSTTTISATPSLSSTASSASTSASASASIQSEESRIPDLLDFVATVIRSSGVSHAVVISAIIYLERAKRKLPSSARGMACTAHRLFLAALVIATKFLHDRAIKNRAWSQLHASSSTSSASAMPRRHPSNTGSLFSLQDVNLMERQMLGLLEFKLVIDDAEVLEWGLRMGITDAKATESQMISVTAIQPIPSMARTSLSLLASPASAPVSPFISRSSTPASDVTVANTPSSSDVQKPVKVSSPLASADIGMLDMMCCEDLDQDDAVTIVDDDVDENLDDDAATTILHDSDADSVGEDDIDLDVDDVEDVQEQEMLAADDDDDDDDEEDEESSHSRRSSLQPISIQTQTLHHHRNNLSTPTRTDSTFSASTSSTSHTLLATTVPSPLFLKKLHLRSVLSPTPSHASLSSSNNTAFSLNFEPRRGEVVEAVVAKVDVMMIASKTLSRRMDTVAASLSAPSVMSSAKMVDKRWWSWW
ncbi:hypothetical protein HDU97_008862 [Phlyctochytrium planicorne]|nr:hypothetical protein HDU97_008862 [Phlyctochytrium planicorne]